LSVAKKIKLAFSEPFYIQGIALEVSASLGISLFPEHGEDANTLIKRAEMTVYAIKEQERGRYGIYHGGRNTP
jgi:GGDEF domain-containing protein